MEELAGYRERIDEIDAELMNLLEERFQVVRSVGHLKAKQNIAVVQSKRAEEVINRVTNLARDKNIPPEFIKETYTRMIDLAHVIEHEILEKHESK